MKFHTMVEQHSSVHWIIALYSTVTANKDNRILRNVGTTNKNMQGYNLD